MKDLIDRQAALDTFGPWLNVEGYSEGELNMLRAVLYELKTLPTAQPEVAKDTNVPSTDCISRQAAIEGAAKIIERDTSGNNDVVKAMQAWKEWIMALPSAQPDLPEAYAKKVWTWLLDYQTTAAELKAKYSAYEVLSWVVNDWRRGHGGLN